MAFDRDAKLFDVLARGYLLSTQLQALLGRPLDGLGQQEAVAFSQELSQVFKVSMSMLNSNTVTRARTAPEMRTGDSSGVIIQAARDKRARYMRITEGVWTLSFQLYLFTLFFFFSFYEKLSFLLGCGLCLDCLITNIHHAVARSDSGEVVTPVKKRREEGVTRKEITASPYEEDGYGWRKYGQKNIQNCNYVR